MLSLGAEWADVPRRSVHQPMPDHLVLPFEAFSSFGSTAVLHRAIVRSILGVHICVGAVSIRYSHGLGTLVEETHFNRYWV